MKTFITLKKKNHNTTITWKITNQSEDQYFQKQKKVSAQNKKIVGHLKYIELHGQIRRTQVI